MSETVKSILVVDDDMINARLLSGLLTRKGYEVAHAGDGMQGLQLARRQTFDLILMDWLMPKLDGFKTCMLLKRDLRYQSIPILVVTGKSSPEDLQRIQTTGVDGVMSKEGPPTDILDKVQEMIGSSGEAS